MNRRERVITAIRHENTDIVPYHIDFTMQEQERVAEYLGDPDFVRKIGNHIDHTYFGDLDEFMPGYFKDKFGVIWNRSGVDKDIGVIEGLVIPEPVIGSYKFPEIDFNILHERFRNLANSKNETFRLGMIGFSMFERAWSLRGMENLLTDMILEPEFVDWLMDSICDFNMKILDIAMQYDLDGFYFGDDWGQQSGLITGPDLWRKFIKPRMARMYERVKSSGKFVVQHSCGDIEQIFPDLIDIGLDVYQTFQPEIYDIKRIKREFGSKLSFWGGISTQRLLPYSTPEELRKVVPEIIKTMSENGGYIAAPTHSVPGDVPPENIVALIEIFQNQK